MIAPPHAAPAGFMPFPGFSPDDGEDPRCPSSPTNPCRSAVVIDGTRFDQEPCVND